MATTCGRGPPERRRRAKIPGLIGINFHGKPPESGDAASNFPGNSPGGWELPEEFPAQTRSREFPGDPTWNSTGASGAPTVFLCFLPPPSNAQTREIERGRWVDAAILSRPRIAMRARIAHAVLVGDSLRSSKPRNYPSF